jgi:hypothetical protein
MKLKNMMTQILSLSSNIESYIPNKKFQIGFSLSQTNGVLWLNTTYAIHLFTTYVQENARLIFVWIQN